MNRGWYWRFREVVRRWRARRRLSHSHTLWLPATTNGDRLAENETMKYELLSLALFGVAFNCKPPSWATSSGSMWRWSDVIFKFRVGKEDSCIKFVGCVGRYCQFLVPAHVFKLGRRLEACGKISLKLRLDLPTAWPFFPSSLYHPSPFGKGRCAKRMAALQGILIITKKN